jgi:hypothetical protein
VRVQLQKVSEKLYHGHAHGAFNFGQQANRPTSIVKKNMSTLCLKPSSHHVRSVASKDRKYLLVVVHLILHCMHTYALVHILVCGTTDRITVD